MEFLMAHTRPFQLKIWDETWQSSLFHDCWHWSTVTSDLLPCVGNDENLLQNITGDKTWACYDPETKQQWESPSLLWLEKAYHVQQNQITLFSSITKVLCNISMVHKVILLTNINIYRCLNVSVMQMMPRHQMIQSTPFLYFSDPLFYTPYIHFSVA